MDVTLSALSIEVHITRRDAPVHGDCAAGPSLTTACGPLDMGDGVGLKSSYG